MIRYVHVKHTATGAEDMIPETAAPILAEAGDVEILDPTPADWRSFKPRVPLGEPAPKRTKTPASRQVTEPAPQGPTPEEATE